MTRREQIRSAYKQLGGSASFYDGMMTYSTLPGKAVCRLVWNMDGGKNLEYLTRALSGVPEDFAGKLSVRSLEKLEQEFRTRNKKLKIITGHTGWTDDLDFAFAHRAELCKPFAEKYTDPAAPYDGYIEDDDTEESARHALLGKVKTE